MQAELASYKHRSRVDSSTEPDFAVLAYHQICEETQTDVQDKDFSGPEGLFTPSEVDSKMTTSETQTDMNLLADVISLNSSISYSSEEVNFKQQITGLVFALFLCEYELSQSLPLKMTQTTFF